MGARGRPLIRWCLVLALPAIAWSPSVADSAEPEVGGMITEIHVGQDGSRSARPEASATVPRLPC